MTESRAILGEESSKLVSFLRPSAGDRLWSGSGMTSRVSAGATEVAPGALSLEIHFTWSQSQVIDQNGPKLAHFGRNDLMRGSGARPGPKLSMALA